MPAATTQSFTSITQFLSPHFPEGSYQYSADGQARAGKGQNKEYMMGVAKRLFQGNYGHIRPDPFPVTLSPSSRRFSFIEDSGHKWGRLEIQEKIDPKNPGRVFPEKIDIEFDEKKLSCRFVASEIKTLGLQAKNDLKPAVKAICSATDHDRQVVAGGQWVSCAPYALLVGAAYYGGHAIVEIGQTGYHVLKAVITEVTPQKESAKRDIVRIVKLVFKIFQDRDQIQISQEETLGTACRRIGSRLLRAGVLSTAAVGIYLYDSQQIRI